jgi:transposase
MEPNYIGVDLHKRFFQACALTPTGGRVWEERFPCTAEGLAAFRGRCHGETRVAVEATGPTWHFVDAVEPTGAQVCVVDTRKTRLKAGFAAKTDRLDARRLADALRRESVVSIYVPSPAIRELRELCRGRHHLVRLRTRVIQTLHALLLRAGVGDPPVTRLYNPRGVTWVTSLPLPAESDLARHRLVRILQTVHVEATAADTAVRARAAGDPIVAALETIKGMGPVLALTLRAELGTIARFPDGPHLASFAGLVPGVEISANHRWCGRITRQGSPWVRWALVEAAMHAMKRDDVTGRRARRLALRKGVLKARVPLARMLCDDVLRVWPRETD